jgi:hypothetical protein
MSNYGIPTGKIKIKSLDDGTLVTAQYNPKEFEIKATPAWSETGEANKAGIHQEFGGAKARTVTLELTFDGYEQALSSPYTVDVAEEVGKLQRLATVIEPGSQREEKRRPHWCVASWGTSLRAFRCVITSLSTKYTMFDAGGRPLRATCNVTLSEADSVKAKGSGGAGGTK